MQKFKRQMSTPEINITLFNISEITNQILSYHCSNYFQGYLNRRNSNHFPTQLLPATDILSLPRDFFCSNGALVCGCLLPILVKGFIFFNQWHGNKWYLQACIEMRRKSFVINFLELLPIDICAASSFSGTPETKLLK